MYIYLVIWFLFSGFIMDLIELRFKKYYNKWKPLVIRSDYKEVHVSARGSRFYAGDILLDEAMSETINNVPRHKLLFKS